MYKPMRKSAFLTFAIIFAMALFSSSLSANPLLSQANVEAALKEEAKYIADLLIKEGKLQQEQLPGLLPPEFRMIQQEKMNLPGKYMSETEPIKNALSACKAFMKANKGYDLCDVLIANFFASKTKHRASKNVYLILDLLVINESIGEWAENKEEILRIMRVRRLFSDFHHALTQQFYLKAPFKQVQAKLPPKFVQGLSKIILMIPGQLGAAIKDTLVLLGIEDLTASIFAKPALERLTQDRRLRQRITLFYSLLEERMSEGLTKPDNSSTAYQPNIWQMAMSVSSNESEAMELLGVFCTQHRTLIKTLMPRTESRKAQLPLVEPLIRCASNFFLIVEINEATKHPEYGYRFAYPEGYQTSDWKFYHFWSEAFIAWTLLKKGYSERIVKTVCHNLALGYESYTLPKNIKYAIKSKSKISPMLVGWKNDINEHKKGTAFAISIWKKAKEGK